jgi:glyoxylase-like metal-dependent hydrolase (beta-lactamase superfamily II)
MLINEARDRNQRRPMVVGHELVSDRFDRYDLTNGYNAIINARQFRGMGMLGAGDESRPLFPTQWVRPNMTYSERLQLRVGDVDIELHHGKGETDDHTWAWLPEYKAICCGDFLTWVFPNAGNPAKVQRYPLEWARVLREMAAHNPELLLPAHGLPIAGAARIRTVLDDVATVLERLVEETLQLMNDGATLDQVLQTVKLPPQLIDKPYLQPTYDEPEFVVRNIWRLYGGWYDGNPARLKPPSDSAVAMEVANVAGGIEPLIRKAPELRANGEPALATHFIELCRAGRARRPGGAQGPGPHLQGAPPRRAVAHGPGHLRLRGEAVGGHRGASRGAGGRAGRAARGCARRCGRGRVRPARHARCPRTPLADPVLTLGPRGPVRVRLRSVRLRSVWSRAVWRWSRLVPPVLVAPVLLEGVPVAGRPGPDPRPACAGSCAAPVGGRARCV